MDGEYLEVSARGGKTRIEVRTPSGEELVGEAVCSKEDNWNRKMGNEIALGRALQTLKNS